MTVQPENITEGTPRAFYVEHGKTKYRVMAVVTYKDRPDTIQAVLTCTDPAIAYRVVRALYRCLNGGPSRSVEREVDGVAAELPHAPAASLRQAAQQLLTGTWRVDILPPKWGEIARDPDEAESLSDENTTPHDGRLADMPGSVVRVIQLLEIHVHDPERFLRSVYAEGFEQVSPDERADDDPDDLVGAVMHLAGSELAAPGADVITDQSTGQLLRAEKGDEVADWSPTPIQETFDAGWRLRGDRRRSPSWV